MISLALATHNEESNVADCIQSCKGLVDEIVVVDGSSTDKTAEIARQNNAKVIITDNPSMFHINKQKAIDACTGEWILQLDADERVTPELASEIKKVIGMTNEEISKYQEDLKEKELFSRHQTLVAQRATRNVSNDSRYTLHVTRYTLHDERYNAFFIARLNFFLGGYLRSGGVYPDGVIRLIRKGKAYLPCKSVHELMTVVGKTGWLANPLIHRDSPTFKRYLARNSRYIDQLTEEISQIAQRTTHNVSNDSRYTLHATRYTLHVKLISDYVLIKPITTFFSLFIRHKGFLDGWRGAVWAFFSAIRFARAYWRYAVRRRF